MKVMWGRRAAVLAVALVLFVGCGGGSSDDGDTTTDQGGDVSTTAAASDDGGGTTEPTDDETTTTEAEDELVMPDLTGITEDEARAELADLGYDGDIEIDEQESLEEAGTVVDQVPGAGQPTGESATLVVAVPVGPVPDFVGQQISAVESWAEERAIAVRIEEVPDDTLADGEVVSTTPAADEEATTEILVQVARIPSVVQLSELEPVDSACSYEAGELSVNGEILPNTVWQSQGTYSNDECFLDYNLSRDFVRLKSTIGLSDDSSSDAQIRFEVFDQDGTSLFNQVVAFGSTADVDIDVSDVLRVRLQVTRLSGEDAYPAWGDVRVIGTANTGGGSDDGEDEGSDGTDEDDEGMSQDGSTTTTEP